MFKKRKTYKRRRAFLIDSNQTQRKGRSGKKYRNKLLRFFLQFRVFGQLFKVFRGSVLLWVVLSCVFIFIIIAFFSPYFDVKKVSFIRDNPILDIEKLETEINDYYGENMFMISRSEIESSLKDKFPELRSVEIKDIWPSELQIKIKISPPFANLQNEETANFWTISQDGVALEMSAGETFSTIRVFQYTESISTGKKIFEENVLQSIFLGEDYLKKEVKIAVKEIHYYSVSQEIHYKLENNTVLWIDLSQNIEKQLNKLKLSSEKIGLYSKSLEHVDLRIPKQIFYK